MKKRSSVKIIALILVLVLISALTPFGVFAAGTKRFGHSDVIPGGHGVGYFDTSGDDAIELGPHSTSCMRNGEWHKYSLSGLEPGYYNVYFNGGNTSKVTLQVMINDEVAIEKFVKPATEGYYEFDEALVGQVYIPNRSSTITVKNIGGSTYWLNLYVESVEYSKSFQKLEQKSAPYKFSKIPCVIEAENFDSGLNGVDYFGTSGENILGNYRPYAKMNIAEKDDGSYSLSLSNNEWTKYTVYVPQEDSYELKIGTKAVMPDSKLRIYIDNYEVVHHVTLTDKDNYKEFSLGSFKLSQGSHMIALKCIEGDTLVDYLRFSYSAAEGKTIGAESGMRLWKDTQESEYIEPVDVEEERPIMKEIYVSSSAKDGGDGSQGKPYNNITSAKEAVRKLNKNMSGDIVVKLNGEFFITEPISLGTEDSGSNGFKVIWEGNEETVISGGEKIDGFTKVEGTPLYKTTVNSDGFRQLYINDNRAVRARSKYFIKRKAIYYDAKNAGVVNEAAGIIMDGNDIEKPFVAGKGLELVLCPSWMVTYIPVSQMFENEDGDYVIMAEQPILDCHSDGIGGYLDIEQFYFQNAPELLDEPGEFYFNKETKELFYYPLSFENLETANVYIPKSEGLLYIQGSEDNFASDITVRGITFKHGAWEKPSQQGFSVRQGEEMKDPFMETDEYSGTYRYTHVHAQIQIDYAKNIDIKNNVFTNLGSAGIHVNKASCLVNVTGNLFDDIAAGAVALGTFAVPKAAPVEDLVHDVKVSNNVVRRTSVEYQSSSGISTYYVNNVDITHNDIYQQPYSAITFGWGWGNNRENCGDIRVTYNKIVDSVTNLFDGASVYTLGKMPGSIIANNYMARSGDNRGGVYLDSNSQNITIKNNVFDDLWKPLVAITAAQYNKMNNTAINNYCVMPLDCDGLDINSFEPMKGKVNGQWPKEAQDIISQSGLTSQYAHILEEYNARENLVNYSQNWPNAVKGEGLVIYAGDVTIDGKDVYWQDSAVIPDAGMAMDGTRVKTIMSTLQGEWTAYDFEITESGYYDIIMNASTSSTADYAANTKVDIEIDGKLVADKAPLNPSGHYFKFKETTMAHKVYLEAGKHHIKIVHAKNNFGFKWTRIVKSDIEAQGIIPKDGFNEEYLKHIIK